MSNLPINLRTKTLASADDVMQNLEWLEEHGGKVPSGTGFIHVTNGVQDAAAALVKNADVDATAAIEESKLALASDAAAGTASRRTLGTGATQAAPGNHSHTDATTASAGFLSAADKTKLNGIAAGATANDTDANLKNRTNHTGTQAASTITGLGDAATKNTGTAAGTVAAGDDARFSNARTPTGAAGGVLSGTYPNPTFASAMATQSALDTHTARTDNPHATQFAQLANKPTTLDGYGVAGIPTQARITGFYNFRSAFQYESDVALVNQRAYWMRFAVEQTPVTISALRLYIAAASAAGGVMQLRFCADNNAMLGTVTHEFPNVATDAAGWVESAYGSNIVFQPGFHWLLCLPLFSGTAPTVTCYRGNDGRFGVGSTEASEPGFYRNSISALPATGGTLGGSGTTASAIPRLRFRVP